MSLARLGAVRGLLPVTGDGIDAILVTDNININYVSGFSGSTAMLFITADEAQLLTDFRYTAQARNQCPDFEIVDISQPDSLGQFIESRSLVKKVGFESLDVTVGRLDGWRKHSGDVTWVPVAGVITALRLVKDADEIGIIRHAIAVAEDSFKLVSALLEPGTTEEEFALELEFAMRRAGASAASFDIIVASGENGAFPHHRAGQRAFQIGDLVTIDWGAKYRGYCSDITRTVVIGPGITNQQREIYDIVKKAKELATEAIKPGKTGKEIDAVARDYIGSKGYGQYFGHSLGHSLGLDVHDGATLSVRADTLILKPGIVTTVEPGIYIEGFGGVRIEEDVLVTEDGCEILTSPSPELMPRV